MLPGMREFSSAKSILPAIFLVLMLGCSADPVGPSAATPSESERRARVAKLKSSVPAVPEKMRLTLKEVEVIRQQVIRCWVVDLGARNDSSAADYRPVTVRVWLDPDGTVRDARAIRSPRPVTPARNAFIDAAEQALRHPNCLRIKIPLEKYEVLKTFSLRFDTSDMEIGEPPG